MHLGRSAFPALVSCQENGPDPALEPGDGCDQQGRDCFIHLTELNKDDVVLL